MIILSWILSLLFILLSGLHFSWALGGTWGFDNALPTNLKGEKILNPGKLDCVVVGLGLLAFALFYLLQSNIIILNIPQWIMNLAGWSIPSIFIVRAIGEFNYVGFFKKIKDTAFGKLDTKIYSPLCAMIGVMGWIIQYLS